jgi:hypothetical protein
MLLANESTSASTLFRQNQAFRRHRPQLGDVERDPPRFVFGQQIRRDGPLAVFPEQSKPGLAHARGLDHCHLAIKDTIKFKSFDDIGDHSCFAWNTLIEQPWKMPG